MAAARQSHAQESATDRQQRCTQAQAVVPGPLPDVRHSPGPALTTPSIQRSSPHPSQRGQRTRHRREPPMPLPDLPRPLRRGSTGPDRRPHDRRHRDGPTREKSNSTGGISSTPGMFTTTVGAGPAKTCLRSQARHRHSPSSEALQRRPSARALATERHCARTPARPRSGPVAGQQRTSEGRSRRFAWSGAVSKNLLAASICTGIRIRRRQVDLRGQIPHPRSLRFAPPRPQTRRAQRSVTSTEPARVRLRGVLTWAFGSAPNQHGSRHRPSKTGATRQFRRGLSVGCSRLWSTPPTRVWPWGT